MTAQLPGLSPIDSNAAPTTDQPPARRGRHLSRRRLYLRRFLRNRGALVGLVILSLLVLFALLGAFFTSYTYLDVDFANLSDPPSPDHLFGTNGAGNDTFAQSVHGLQRSLVIALVVSLLTTAISAVVGAAAAYIGGITEKIILEIIHFLLVVPAFL
jgi:peptide/nickel transport system permease protein